MKRLLFAVSLVVAIVTVIILAIPMLNAVSAQSPLDDFNPPLGTSADNECNEPGIMYPGCTRPIDWICGWMLARYNRSIISYEQVRPQSCHGPVQAAAPSVAVCEVDVIYDERVTTCTCPEGSFFDENPEGPEFGCFSEGPEPEITQEPEPEITEEPR